MNYDINDLTFEEKLSLLTGKDFWQTYDANGKLDSVFMSDGPNGLRKCDGEHTEESIAMPCISALANSWSEETVFTDSATIADECAEKGVDILLAPGVNIKRTPLCGRNFEYFSEDPYLTAIAAVNEIQGIQSKGVIANVKHIAFNDQESHRSGGSVWLNEQEAREIMLLPFEYALSSKEGMGNAHAVMSAMNRIGTDWVGANTNVLVDIMRGEWDFDGYCITDMAASDTAYIMNYQDGISRGTDLFLGSGSKTALSSFRKNASFCLRMREASHRILYAVCNYSAAMNGITPETKVTAPVWWWQITIISADCVFGVLTAGAAAMYVLCLIKQYGAKKEND